MWQLPGILAHHQLTGFLHTPLLYKVIHKRINLLTRNLGHLSSAYCLLFDKTGHFVFTGADDGLVKMWSIHTGRLIFTFRGASSEITDIDVSANNRMIAAGSMDGIIRVWSLLSAAPVAVFKQRGIIHSLNFSPGSGQNLLPYLISTASDGTVSFWKFTYEDKSMDRAIFDLEPTRYHEKMRPGKSQMISSHFSSGGLFLATGSADRHVRIYKMDGQDGPVKVLEEAAHSDRVDSIRWGHRPLLRFISGSKDGTARLWSYQGDTWINVELKVEHRRTVRLTTLTWNCDDTKIITATSDATICVWDAFTAFMIASLKGHKDEIYVLEPHPCRPEIVMSGAHDGKLIIWDISTTEILFQHYNNIDGQSHGAVYDAKWSPDSLNFAASDSHGHVLVFGMTSKQPYEGCPNEMFFHTDYRPLLRDSSHHVVDEQNQCAPHLLPPPFLVNMEGNPYPDDVQMLVPGREHHYNKESLAPTECSESAASHSQSRGDASNGAADNERAPNQHTPSIVEHSYNAAARLGEFQVPDGSSHLTESIWRKRELIPQSLYRGAKDFQGLIKEFGVEEMKLFKLGNLRIVEPLEQNICQASPCGGDGDAPPFSTRRLRPKNMRKVELESENTCSDLESDANEDSDFSLDESEIEAHSDSSDDICNVASLKNTTRFNEMAASNSHNMNYLKNPSMFSDIDAGTPSPTQLKSSFEYPLTPDTYQQYLPSNFIENNPLPSFSQWQQIQQQMIQLQRGACSNFIQTPHPGERSLMQTGGEDKDIPARVMQDVSNKNNNFVIRKPEEESAAPAAEPVKYECPGCDMFFELDSASFVIHVRGTHRIRNESDGFKYFMKKHPAQKKTGSTSPPKLMSCGICGTLYKEVDDMNKCVSKHKVDQMREKTNEGVKKRFAPKQASQPIVKELLRCEVEGCKDKRGFISRETLFKHHRKIHHIFRKDTKKSNVENTRYPCPFCMKCFATNGNLLRHMAGCQNKPEEVESTQPKELGDTQPKELGDTQSNEMGDTQSKEGGDTRHMEVFKTQLKEREPEKNKPVENQGDNEIAPQAGTSEEICLTFSQSSTEGMILQ